ncbi:hypothetical protein GWK47_019018 [Chionoecetes opilio]|uniref:Uncharacterized protein n=1 Tax=Chionoecetes opilio TaxID=41210 RepID=A0A8J5CJ47_CHIOP|nr:hypothetical protein GWK47_019018 [Chionoecetes opilio]
MFLFSYFLLFLCSYVLQLVMNSVDASSLRGWRVALAGGQELVMNSVDASGHISVTSESAVETLGEDAGGGGVNDSIGTQMCESDDDDDDMPSSPGSFDDDGSMAMNDDVTAQLAAAGGWSGERRQCVYVVVEGANDRLRPRGSTQAEGWVEVVVE